MMITKEDETCRQCARSSEYVQRHFLPITIYNLCTATQILKERSSWIKFMIVCNKNDLEEEEKNGFEDDDKDEE